MKKIITIIIIIKLVLIAQFSLATENLTQKLSGQILLQVESNGEAWYVNPADYKRYYLARPSDAFDLMCALSVGITDEDLAKIPIGVIEYDDQDDDNDDLANRLEQALGTDPQKADTDEDGYNDFLEIISGYSPVGVGALPINIFFSQKQAGKILLQSENHGETWYVNPLDNKRYYLGRPADAFKIMKQFGLGITNNNIQYITEGSTRATPPASPPYCPECQRSSATQVMVEAADAIRSGDINRATAYFTEELHGLLEYNLNFLDAESRFLWAGMLSSTSLSNESETNATFSGEVYFSLGGYKVPIYYNIEKQADSTWKFTNL